MSHNGRYRIGVLALCSVFHTHSIIANGHTHYLKQGLKMSLYVSNRELISSPEIVLLCRFNFIVRDCFIFATYG